MLPRLGAGAPTFALTGDTGRPMPDAAVLVHRDRVAIPKLCLFLRPLGWRIPCRLLLRPVHLCHDDRHVMPCRAGGVLALQPSSVSHRLANGARPVFQEDAGVRGTRERRVERRVAAGRSSDTDRHQNRSMPDPSVQSLGRVHMNHRLVSCDGTVRTSPGASRGLLLSAAIRYGWIHRYAPGSVSRTHRSQS